jgi:hypothetical protein
MRTIALTIAAAIVTLMAHNSAMAENDRSLAQVAAIVADALAAKDDIVLEKYLMTYEEAATVSKKIEKDKSAYAKRIREDKQAVEEAWREVHQAGILVEHVRIEDVRIKKISKDAAQDRFTAIAIAVPVFLVKDEPKPVPMMALFFVQIGGRWKYTYCK